MTVITNLSMLDMYGPFLMILKFIIFPFLCSSYVVKFNSENDNYKTAYHLENIVVSRIFT